MFDGMMGPNAQFYDPMSGIYRPMWKPRNSEENSPICRDCEEKRSACFVVRNLDCFNTYLHQLLNNIIKYILIYTNLNS